MIHKSEADTTHGSSMNAWEGQLARILSSALAALTLCLALMWFLGVRPPLDSPDEDPTLVALTRDPVAVSMVKWLRDDIEITTKRSPERIGCYRTTTRANCVVTFPPTLYVKVWIDSGGAHWRPLPRLSL